MSGSRVRNDRLDGLGSRFDEDFDARTRSLLLRVVEIDEIGRVELALGATGQLVVVGGDVLGGGARHSVRCEGLLVLVRRLLLDGDGMGMVKGMGMKPFSVGPPGGARERGHGRRLNSHSLYSRRLVARAIDVSIDEFFSAAFFRLVSSLMRCGKWPLGHLWQDFGGG